MGCIKLYAEDGHLVQKIHSVKLIETEDGGLLNLAYAIDLFLNNRGTCTSMELHDEHKTRRICLLEPIELNSRQFYSITPGS